MFIVSSLFIILIKIVRYSSFFIEKLFHKNLFYFFAIQFKRLCIKAKLISNKLHRSGKKIHPRLAINMPSGNWQSREIIHPWVKWSSLSLYTIMPFKNITISLVHLSFQKPIVPFFHFWPIFCKLIFVE